MKSLIFVFSLLTLIYQTSISQNNSNLKNMSTGAIKLENRFSDEVVNNHNVDLLNDILGDDFISHHFPQPGQNNKATFIGGMKSLLKAFPDIHIVRGHTG